MNIWERAKEAVTCSAEAMTERERIAERLNLAADTLTVNGASKMAAWVREAAVLLREPVGEPVGDVLWMSAEYHVGTEVYRKLYSSASELRKGLIPVRVCPSAPTEGVEPERRCVNCGRLMDDERPCPEDFPDGLHVGPKNEQPPVSAADARDAAFAMEDNPIYRSAAGEEEP